MGFLSPNYTMFFGEKQSVWEKYLSIVSARFISCILKYSPNVRKTSPKKEEDMGYCYL